MTQDNPNTCKPKIFIVDDEVNIRWIVSELLNGEGYETHGFESAEEALAGLKSITPDVCLIDINLDGMNGLAFLGKLKKKSPSSVPVIITSQSSMDWTIRSIQEGAFDFIAKPFDLDEISQVTKEAFRESELRRKYKKRLVPKNEINGDLIVGKSKQIKEIYKAIGRVSNSGLSVFIEGESGTGKELIARAIHQNSDRKQQPFVAINCAAIPNELLESDLFGHVRGAFTGATETTKGKFELADQGTLFLDEIGDMPLNLQSKILRALQEREFQKVGSDKTIKINVRVISATHQSLENLIEEHKFRRDLYYRLNVFKIISPPLRERKGDIELMTRHFLKKILAEMGRQPVSIETGVLERLKNYHWPGNVRELENTVKTMVINSGGGVINFHSLPGYLLDKTDETKTNQMFESSLADDFEKILSTDPEKQMEAFLAKYEKLFLQTSLKKYGGNQLKTAKYLGINRNTLKKKINLYQIKAREK